MATATETRPTWLQMIAAELGEGWTAEMVPPQWEYGTASHYLEHSDGTRIAARGCGDYPAANRGKVRFAADVPAEVQFRDYSGHPSIRVSESRPAAAVARELQRRLIGDARKWCHEQQRRHDDTVNRAATRDAVAGRLSALCGETPRVFQGEAEFYVGASYHSVSVRPGGTVDIKVSGIDEATAAAVLAVLLAK